MEQVQKLVEIANHITDLAANWQEIQEITDFCTELWDGMVAQNRIGPATLEQIKTRPLTAKQKAACFMRLLEQLEMDIDSLQSIIAEKNNIIESLEADLAEYQ